jgi:hypothetical protein
VVAPRLAIAALVLLASHAAAAPARFVVVADGTPVFTSREASESELTLPMKSFDPFLFEWVAAHGERTEVRTLDLGDATDLHLHCGQRPGPFRGLVVTLFVPTASLRTVTVRRVEQRFPDGTGFVLLPGQAVEPLGNGSFRVPSLFARIELELPPDALGHIFTSEGKTFYPHRDDSIELTAAAATPLLLGGRRLAGVKSQSLVRSGIELDRQVSPGIYEHTDACLKLALAVPDDQVERRDLSGGVVGGLVGTERRQARPRSLPRGTPIFFRNGAPAGRTAQKIDVQRATPSPPGKSCFTMKSAGQPYYPETPFVFCTVNR